MVSKLSEITIEDVAKYIRVDDYEESDIATYLNIAKNYISSYTGIPVTSEEGESLDDFPDFVIVVYILCQDMYDNRTLYVDKANINKTVQTILDMHTRNNL
jgi:uncharacterized phage protein (predicted DNA packaging)